ncbi:MAG: stage II sporulation protein M [Sulfurihydrogenibium sp.]|nr:stage II sporulation protein M [Sulfurihydrogenibium sp.]
MVLESLVSLKEGIKNPWSVFYLSAIVSIVSFVISFLVFKQDVGFYSVILTTLGLTPFMTKLNLYEAKKSLLKEKKDITDFLFFYAKDKKSIWRVAGITAIPFIIAAILFQSFEMMLLILVLYVGVFLLFSLIFLSFYREVIMSFVAIFAGMTLVFSLLYLLLPSEVAEKSFQTQINEIKAIRGYFWFGGTFQTILINNIGVLFLSFIFSLIYGSGAIFILAWNASILATAASMLAKSLGGAYKLPIALLSYMPHGSLEIVAYFLAAIAGGIASYHLTRSKEIKVFLEDCLFLLALGMVFLLLGAIVETASMVA